MKSLTFLVLLAGIFTLPLSCTAPCGIRPAEAAEEVRGEVLLTVAPCPPGLEMKAYLDDIAGSAGAIVARVYIALTMTEEDPILLLIRSETESNDAMIAVLEADKRVWSATPNTVRIRRVPEVRK